MITAGETRGKRPSTSPTTRRGGSNKFLAEGVGRLIVGSWTVLLTDRRPIDLTILMPLLVSLLTTYLTRLQSPADIMFCRSLETLTRAV